jgi:altronate dehydratase
LVWNAVAAMVSAVSLQILRLVYTSDLLVELGGTVILSEFPELCGVEQNLSDRCV